MTKKKVKISSHLPGVHGIVTRGSIPHPTSSLYLNLHVREKQLERLLDEQEQLRRKNRQIKNRIKMINREIKKFLKLATGKEWVKVKESSNPDNLESFETKRNQTILGY